MKKIISNPEAEKAVIGGILKYGKDAYYDIIDIVNNSCFTVDNHHSIWLCFEHIFEQSDSIDISSVLAYSNTLGIKIDAKYLQELSQSSVKLENIRPHSKQIAKLDLIRNTQKRLMEAYHDLEKLDGSETTDQIIGIPEGAIFSISDALNNQNDNVPELLGTNLRERMEFLAKNPVEMVGIPTPWVLYNHVIGGGLRPGVHLVCARPKQGKSSHALNAGLHFSEKLKLPTLYVDTEMRKEEQENRLLATYTQLDNDLIETGKFALDNNISRKVFDAIDKIDKISLHHRWVGGKDFNEILSIIRRWIYSSVGFDSSGRPNRHVVIFDYFKLMNEGQLDKLGEHQVLGFQISHLSDFCKKYNTPVLAYTQINRDGITKDTSDVISQSDRLLWLCISACLLKRKEKEEIIEDGFQYGNRKLIPLEGRFMKQLDFGDYIHMNLDGATTTFTELGTKFNSKKQQDNQSFETSNIF